MSLLSNHTPDEDAIRMAVAELSLFGAVHDLPDAYLQPITEYIASRPAGWDIEHELAAELTYLRGTVRYHRFAAGLPRMAPPSLDELNAVFWRIAGRDLSIVRMIRSN